MVLTFRILIANRGEIAIRIARSVRELGYKPIGIYTAIDKDSLHRRFMAEDTDVASYIDIDEVIDAAIRMGADAIHPGYGFLSENPVFAKTVISKGLIFIGPPPEVMELAGDKVRAKEEATKAGIPTLPWMNISDPKDILEFGREHGYPLLIKAVGGGGGMGMRIVREPREAEKYYEQARKETENAFRDPRLYVEPYIEAPKHIEVQILGDGENIIHLYERDCSVQRRYQKIIEEAPASILSSRERKSILSDAVELMRQIGYVSAGTVEMLYDPVKKKHYFMEINARLQVEHPVTEMITGIDIVKHQILIAINGQLELKQNKIKTIGHAIEARINAENPVTLLPSPGTIVSYLEPSGPGVRVDSGVTQGSRVPGEYNPLIAKLIVWGRDRLEAISRLRRALNEYVITGIQTNIPLLKAIVDNPVFRKGAHTTRFIEEESENIKRYIRGIEVIHSVLLSALAYKAPPKVKAKIVSGTRLASYIDGNVHPHREAIKRKAWVYWVLLRSRVTKGRKSGLKRNPSR
jgi:acetyl/propionyl-CoA carboxylase alpha subunit